MLNKLIIIALSATGSLANLSRPSLFSRELVPIPCEDQNRKTCGAGCIDFLWTCCPDMAGGCGPTDYCILGDNGEYGCCPKGLDCSGDGGAITSGLTITSTIVDTVTDVNTETPVVPPVTDEPVPTSTTILPPVTDVPISTTTEVVETETVAPPTGTETMAVTTEPVLSTPSPPAETTATVPVVVGAAASINAYSLYTLSGLLAGVFALFL